ncbi:MAG: hypothetical protein WCF20_00650, partial [Methylovirgula sp.]
MSLTMRPAHFVHQCVRLASMNLKQTHYRRGRARGAHGNGRQLKAERKKKTNRSRVMAGLVP